MTSTNKQYCVLFSYIVHVSPDHLVLLGNHRDGWMYGAADASSGTSAMMETSRVLGNLIKNGNCYCTRVALTH